MFTCDTINDETLQYLSVMDISLDVRSVNHVDAFKIMMSRWSDMEYVPMFGHP
jgi:hypothetical protein